jgi:hypothetical protein
MFADTDIAARTIWLRNDAYCAPRMEAATRWALSVNACDFRQTLSFLKSLTPKVGVINAYAHPRFLLRSSVLSQSRASNCPGLSRSAKSVQRAAGGSVVLSFGAVCRPGPTGGTAPIPVPPLNAPYFGAPRTSWNGPSPCS